MDVLRRLQAGLSGEARGKGNPGHKVGEREGTPEALCSHQPAGHEVRAGQRGLDWRGSSGRTGRKSEEEGGQGGGQWSLTRTLGWKGDLGSHLVGEALSGQRERTSGGGGIRAQGGQFGKSGTWGWGVG